MLSPGASYTASLPCPCGDSKTFGQCCGPYIQGKVSAPTAETLMRSRYSAYCLKNIDYLLKTHHPKHRQLNSRKQISDTANTTNWAGLTVIDQEKGQAEDATGIVEFVALYKVGKSVAQLHERSQFIKEGDQWFYTEGKMLPPLKPKRNEPCWCQSGKKFKQCHGRK